MTGTRWRFRSRRALASTCTCLARTRQMRSARRRGLWHGPRPRRTSSLLAPCSKYRRPGAYMCRVCGVALVHPSGVSPTVSGTPHLQVLDPHAGQDGGEASPCCRPELLGTVRSASAFYVLSPCASRNPCSRLRAARWRAGLARNPSAGSRRSACGCNTCSTSCSGATTTKSWQTKRTTRSCEQAARS